MLLRWDGRELGACPRAGRKPAETTILPDLRRGTRRDLPSTHLLSSRAGPYGSVPRPKGAVNVRSAGPFRVAPCPSNDGRGHGSPSSPFRNICGGRGSGRKYGRLFPKRQLRDVKSAGPRPQRQPPDCVAEQNTAVFRVSSAQSNSASDRSFLVFSNATVRSQRLSRR
jgi:hypothetical protein